MIAILYNAPGTGKNGECSKFISADSSTRTNSGEEYQRTCTSCRLAGKTSADVADCVPCARLCLVDGIADLQPQHQIIEGMRLRRDLVYRMSVALLGGWLGVVRLHA